ncbi:MAG TPA: hypothetical protein VGM07_21725 [Stellaceae bacterium]|jgi:hypothetical protein
MHERNDKGNPEIVQWKLLVPAEVRHLARVEAAKRDVTMSRFVAEAVREAAARSAGTEARGRE